MTVFQHSPAWPRALALIAVTSAALAGNAAHAEGWYAGGGLGRGDINRALAGVEGSTRGAAGKLYGGFAFSPNFALEAGAVRFGVERSDFGVEASARGAFVDAVGRMDIAPNWSLLGRAGLVRVRVRGPDAHDSASGLELGVGVEYAVSRGVALRGEYQQAHVREVFGDKPHLGLWTVGLKVDF